MLSPRADADVHARRCANAHHAGHRAASLLFAHHPRRRFHCLRARISIHPVRMSLLHFNTLGYRTLRARAGQHRKTKHGAANAATHDARASHSPNKSNVSRHAFGARCAPTPVADNAPWHEVSRRTGLSRAVSCARRAFDFVHWAWIARRCGSHPPRQLTALVWPPETPSVPMPSCRRIRALPQSARRWPGGCAGPTRIS